MTFVYRNWCIVLGETWTVRAVLELQVLHRVKECLTSLELDV